MAITITKVPGTILPVLQPSVFEVKSSSTQVPLRIKADLGNGSADSIPAIINIPVKFEISDFIKVLFPTMAPVTSSIPVKCPYAPIPVQIEFSEVYGSPPSSHNPLDSETYFAIPAKVPQGRKTAFYSEYSGIFDYLVYSKNLLTWWPKDEYKHVIPGYQEFIYYIQLIDPNSLTINLDILVNFTDGTSQAMPSNYSDLTPEQYEVFYFPVGYNQLGIDSWMQYNNIDKTVDSYHIRIKRGITTPSYDSEWYKFKVDRKFYPRVRQLWIRNPFGFYETILLTGSGKLTSETKPESAITDGIDRPGKLNWKNTITNTITANTGWMSENGAIWLAELLDTVESFEYLAGILHPIVMKDVKTIPIHDNDYQFASELEWEYAPNNHAEAF